MIDFIAWVYVMMSCGIGTYHIARWLFNKIKPVK
jgi:hypothetical protein